MERAAICATSVAPVTSATRTYVQPPGAGTLRNASSGEYHTSIGEREQALSPRTVFTVLLLVGAVVPLGIAWHFGALGIPRNDDWSYALSAFRLADSGRFDGNGLPSMNLVGQLVLSRPTLWLFGHRFTALQIEVALLGFVGLLAVYDLGTRVLLPRR